MNFGADPARWRQVLDQANAGELTLDPDVGVGLRKVCNVYLAKLGDISELSRQVQDLTGFGKFESGEALEKKFSAKAAGTDQSFNAIIKQHIDVVKLAQQVVEKAISNFKEQNQDWASRFGDLYEQMDAE